MTENQIETAAMTIFDGMIDGVDFYAQAVEMVKDYPSENREEILDSVLDLYWENV
jgi:hypothetical protein